MRNSSGSPFDLKRGGGNSVGSYNRNGNYGGNEDRNNCIDLIKVDNNYASNADLDTSSRWGSITKAN